MSDKNSNLWTKLMSTFSTSTPPQPAKISVTDLPKFSQHLEQMLVSVTNVLNDQYANGYPVKLKQKLTHSVDRLKILSREISSLTNTIQRVNDQISSVRTKNEALREQVKILRASKRRKLAILRDERAHSQYLTESLRTSNNSRSSQDSSTNSIATSSSSCTNTMSSAVVPFVMRPDHAKKLRFSPPVRRIRSASGIHLELSPIQETEDNTDDDDDDSYYETLV